MIDLNYKYSELIKILQKEIPEAPDVSLILGSGLGDFANTVDVKKTISTKDLPDYPPSTIEGHEGKIHSALYEGRKLLIFQGRIHFYEGYHISECMLPVFTSYKLNCKRIFITNAAGGVNTNFQPGDLMLINSFNTIFIKKEITQLIGITSEKGKGNLIDFTSKEFNSIIKKAALKEEIDLKEGVYWYNKGPAYETPAEIQMVSRFGGDAVGMSSAHEAIFAAFLGMQVSSVSLITNLAAGLSPKKLTHKEVTETAKLAKAKFERLVKRMISLL